MTKLKIGAVALVLILISSALTYVFAPKKIEYVEKIKTVEVIKTEVRTIVRKETRKDGTIVEETIEEVIKKDEKSKQKDVAKTVTPLKKDWFVTATYSIDADTSVAVQRRIIFDIYAGVYARSDKEIGVALSYSF